jgi:lipocalin
LAPSSGGKSVMLLNSAVHANEVCNKKVLYMSFEMNSWLCLLRHIALTFEVPYSALKDNALAPDELKGILNGLNKRKGKAYFVSDESKGYLKVSFFWPFYGSYVVFELDHGNYQYAFVSGPTMKYLWLLARTPTVKPEVIEKFIEMSKARGFKTEDLIFPQQN